MPYEWQSGIRNGRRRPTARITGTRSGERSEQRGVSGACDG